MIGGTIHKFPFGAFLSHPGAGKELPSQHRETDTVELGLRSIRAGGIPKLKPVVLNVYKLYPEVLAAKPCTGEVPRPVTLQSTS
jgi:hypothetical protein